MIVGNNKVFPGVQTLVRSSYLELVMVTSGQEVFLQEVSLQEVMVTSGQEVFLQELMVTSGQEVFLQKVSLQEVMVTLGQEVQRCSCRRFPTSDDGHLGARDVLKGKGPRVPR
ncbi:S-adenosyl-L-homocysteine hydrolase [Dorcoceras hygrometricum]|uniref:S-adenosyl-L-homocysteine hydrolase n=1 Tax=Dorcoceras hygrometricum TaxID=472368 RepID=A0A2Z7B1H0_9LAMI|nr:S-adenosyl-L-homocysteine hydrolase [Dorcoceras hygrometricum]